MLAEAYAYNSLNGEGADLSNYPLIRLQCRLILICKKCRLALQTQSEKLTHIYHPTPEHLTYFEVIPHK